VELLNIAGVERHLFETLHKRWNSLDM